MRLTQRQDRLRHPIDRNILGARRESPTNPILRHWLVCLSFSEADWPPIGLIFPFKNRPAVKDGINPGLCFPGSLAGIEPASTVPQTVVLPLHHRLHIYRFILYPARPNKSITTSILRSQDRSSRFLSKLSNGSPVSYREYFNEINHA